MVGFVYVMTNDAFPHLVKIGKSSKDPRQDRVNELNHTRVPQPFRVEYYAFVEDESSIEIWLHSYFEKHGPNKAREFFQIVVAEAIVAVRDAAYLRGGIKYEEVFYVSPRELEQRKRKQEQARLREEQQRAEQRAAEERRRQELERVAAEELRRHAASQQDQHERAAKKNQLFW
ncbi:MAG: GIY-YIG nuclease family protein [Rhodobacterales bacterium]